MLYMVRLKHVQVLHVCILTWKCSGVHFLCYISGSILKHYGLNIQRRPLMNI